VQKINRSVLAERKLQQKGKKNIKRASIAAILALFCSNGIS
jgi:hypothetical protein